MATNPLDKKENAGLRAFFNKNFGRDEEGYGFVRKTMTAPFRYLNWNITDLEEVGPMPTFGTLLLCLAPTAGIDFYMDYNTDLQPASYETAETTSAEAISNVYNFNGKLYLLRDTDDGVQLYKQSEYDESSIDDIFTLVPANDAPAIARDISLVYRGIVEQQNGHVDIYSQFESVRKNEPAVMSYDGISGVLQHDASESSYFIIADNVQTQINDRWEPSPQSAVEGLQAWEAALTDMATGQYISYEQNVEIGPSANDVNYPYWLIYAQILGAFAGASAVIGAGSATAASRRRYNDELKYKM